MPHFFSKNCKIGNHMSGCYRISFDRIFTMIQIAHSIVTLTTKKAWVTENQSESYQHCSTVYAESKTFAEGPLCRCVLFHRGIFSTISIWSVCFQCII